MKLASFMTDNGPRWGAVYGDQWLELPAAWSMAGMAVPANTPLDFLEAGEKGLEAGYRVVEAAKADPSPFAAAIHSLDQAIFLPPLYPEGRLFVQRGNSCLFSRQCRLAVPEHPVFELRYGHTMAGHNSLCRFRGRRGGGWNPEFIAVIGKEGREVPVAKLHEHIAGYTMMIDHPTSVRDQFEAWGVAADEMVFRDHMMSGAFYSNAVLPHPVGPWIVTADEVGNPYDLWISATENGRLVEKVHSSATLYSFAETFAFMSRLMTLRAGDMLSTASIGWDGYPYWDTLIPGHYLEVEAEKMGALRMYVEDDPSGEGGQR